MCLSRINAGVGIFGHRYMEFYKIMLLFLVMVNLINTEARLRILSWVLVISYTALAFVARHYWTKAPYPWWDRNDFALQLLSTLPFALFFIFSGKTAITKIEGICYSLVLALICLRTGSRGGFLGLASVFLLFLIHKPDVKKYFVLIPIVLILLSRIGEREIRRYKTIESYETQTTAQQRMGAWRTGLKMLKANPIIGVGTGEFPTKFKQYAGDEEWAMVGGWSNAHSMYVQIAAETGLLGLGIFLSLIGLTLRDIWKLWRIYRNEEGQIVSSQIGMAAAIGFIGFLVSGAFLNVAYLQQLYVLIALIVAARAIAEEKTENNRVINNSEFPYFSIITRTLLLVVCVYLALY